MYISYPVSTSIEIYESQLDDFPSVTICNLYPLKTIDKSSYDYLNQTLSKANLTFEINSRLSTINQVQLSYKYLMANLLNDFFSENLNNSVKFNLDFGDLITSCHFNGEKCDQNDFSLFFSYEFGRCFIFNKPNKTKNIKKTSRTGPGSGLLLEIFTGYPGIDDLFAIQRGIYLAVHNNSVSPSLSYEGIKLPVGTSPEIGIKRVFYSNIDRPTRKCRKEIQNILKDDTEIFKRTVSNGFYTRKNCFEICLLYKFIIPECNCSDPQIRNFDNTIRFCTTLKEIACIEEVRNRFNSKDLSLNCGKECPVSCNTMKYEYQISYSEYPTKFYQNILKYNNLAAKKYENKSWNLLKKSTLMVRVFYQDLSSTFIKETKLLESYNLASTIGNYKLKFKH